MPAHMKIVSRQLLGIVLSISVGRVLSAQTQLRLAGSVLDPSGQRLAGEHIEIDPASGARKNATTDRHGDFSIELALSDRYTVIVEAAGFAAIRRNLQLDTGATNLNLQLEKVATAREEVFVSARVSKIDITSPDPSQKVLVPGAARIEMRTLNMPFLLPSHHQWEEALVVDDATLNAIEALTNLLFLIEWASEPGLRDSQIYRSGETPTETLVAAAQQTILEQNGLPQDRASPEMAKNR